MTVHRTPRRQGDPRSTQVARPPPPRGHKPNWTARGGGQSGARYNAPRPRPLPAPPLAEGGSFSSPEGEPGQVFGSASTSHLGRATATFRPRSSAHLAEGGAFVLRHGSILAANTAQETAPAAAAAERRRSSDPRLLEPLPRAWQELHRRQEQQDLKVKFKDLDLTWMYVA
ncbi:hypothetical protein WMY93_012578 [Mugilogobius chulae]|uniref:Uncharacterized protein n=1 Tax=Mugilogobius chulae TaxID=88201 RepID=A0AAW0P7M2_9GOBI